jgi:hypothetical protein
MLTETENIRNNAESRPRSIRAFENVGEEPETALAFRQRLGLRGSCHPPLVRHD